jgi:D-tyrosyl-tRNA(Tyr) deacylase
MIVVLQRVNYGKVTVDSQVTGEIQKGYVLLVGVGRDDQEEDADYLAEKIKNLRVFNDEENKMNRSILDVGGEILSISQFTLYASTRKGRRPSFTKAADPEKGEKLYQYFNRKLQEHGLTVKTGIFGAMMKVELENDGPVTIILNSFDRLKPRKSAE